VLGATHAEVSSARLHPLAFTPYRRRLPNSSPSQKPVSEQNHDNNEEGHILIEIPLTVGVVGGAISAAFFPILTAVGSIEL
jgi:Domain of unknown function (DUF4342)